LLIARISTINQDELSLEDQLALYRLFLSEHYDGEIKFIVIKTQISGEWLDRVDLTEAKAWLASGTVDLVIVEDLSRIMRHVLAVQFCGFCKDFGTRLIAINDHVDTDHEGWDDTALMASWNHQKTNEHTSKRIKQRMGSRFERDGGVFGCELYGFIKPPNCRGDQDVQLDPEAKVVYDWWFQMLEDGATYAEVADRLNGQGIATGPHCRVDRWTPEMVSRITHNPILKGVRQRNKYHSEKHYQSGKRLSKKAPEEMLKTRNCPHLAHIVPDRYDRVIHILKKRNGRFRRNGSGGADPLKGRSKKRTKWPGQHLGCRICGHGFVYGGHGRADHLFCSGAKAYGCWNGTSVSGTLVRKKLVAAIYQSIESLPEFDQVMIDSVKIKVEKAAGSRTAEMEALTKREEKLQRQRKNLMDAVKAWGPSPDLSNEMSEIAAEVADIQDLRRKIELAQKSPIVLPELATITKDIRAAFDAVAQDSEEFGRLMKRLAPEILVFPVRPVDGGNVVCRAKLTLNMASFVPGAELVSGLREVLQRELTVDLFDTPQRIEYLERYLAIAAKYPNKSMKAIAAEDFHITDVAVQNTAALARKMRELGVTDPYEELREPPQDQDKLCRHLHARYRFSPLEGFPKFEQDSAGDGTT